MKQIIVIHGGDSFKKYENYLNYLKTREVTLEKFKLRSDWKTTLQERLEGDYEIIFPEMPNKTNAKYREWKIWFERMLPLLKNSSILIGHSLGAMFLIKYLAKNNFPKKITQLHLIAPPHNQTEDVEDFFVPDSLENISKQANDIYLYFSKDDPSVPFSEMERYKKQLLRAKFIIFEDRGHFKQQELPELIKNIKCQ
jgi:hypothetical protein